MFEDKKSRIAVYFCISLCYLLCLQPTSFFIFPIGELSAQEKNTETYYQNGMKFLELKKYAEAIAELKLALLKNPGHEKAYQKIIEAFKNHVIALRNKAQYQEALDVGQEALESIIKKDDFANRGRLMVELGLVYFHQGNYPAALDTFRKTLELTPDSLKNLQRAGALNGMGIVYLRKGEFQKALNNSHLALKIYEELDDKKGLVSVLGNICDIYTQLGENSQALSYCEKALNFAREIGDTRNEANTLGSLSIINAYMGEYPRSFEYSKMAIEIYRRNGDKSGESNELTNIGANYLELGDFQAGLKHLKQALAISLEIGEKYKQQLQLGNIGNAYYFLGDTTKALDAFQRARRLAHEIGDKSSEAAWLGGMGAVYTETGDTTIALDHLVQAVDAFAAIGQKRGEAIFSADIANLYTMQGDYARAESYFTRTLKINQEIGNRFSQAETYNGLGVFYLKQQKYPEANDAHNKAFAIAKEMQTSKIIWEAQFGLARVAEKEGSFTDAINLYKQSINTIEATRELLVSEEQKSSFLASRVDIYKSLIHALWKSNQQNFNDVAFRYSEKAKARALLDLLAEAKVALTQDIPENLRKEREKISQKITDLQIKLRYANPPDSSRKKLHSELAEVEKSLEYLAIQIREQSPKYSQITFPTALKLAEVQNSILNKSDLMLAYSLGEENSYLWAITKEKSFSYPLPSRDELQKAVDKYVEDLQMINVPHAALGRELFNLLVKPAVALVNQSEKIIIIPDGFLNYLPFEALVSSERGNPTKYLVEDAQFSYTPSATVLAFLQKNRRTRPDNDKDNLLVFADPFFGENEEVASKVRVSVKTRSQEDDFSLRGWYDRLNVRFPRLVYTSAEADSLAALFPAEKIKIYRRKQATEEKVKSTDLRTYSLVHFATHGYLDELHPNRSAIVLALDDEPKEDGFLQINEIFNLRLNADMVVLSACKTARGKLLRGEGIVGLTRAFFYAGAQSMLGSLWAVGDRSTAKFMAHFYRYMQQGMQKSAALQQAKLDFIKAGTGSRKHPRYWAAFILIGDGM